MRVCDFPGCGRRHMAKGYCTGHYQQSKAGGALVPLNTAKRPDHSPPRVLYDEAPCPVDGLEGPCHVFRGGGTTNGYGQLRADGRTVLVHRYVWQLAHGPIPAGLVIDHICRVRACCNISHLRVVTQHDNATLNVIGAKWQLNAVATHCKHGHEFTPENTYTGKDGKRDCRECNRIKDRRSYPAKLARKKAKKESTR